MLICLIFFNKLNEVNIKLQENKMCRIKSKGIIMAFISKLDSYKNCLLRLDFHHFPSLQALKENQANELCLSDTDLHCFSSHLQALKEDLVI